MSREVIRRILDDVKTLVVVDQYQVYAEIGVLLGRRMFYQLVFIAPYSETPIFFDHTDRYYEVCDQLTFEISKALIYEKVDPSTLPDDMFSDDCVLKKEYRNEDTLAAVINNHLGTKYSFEINQFEICI